MSHEHQSSQGEHGSVKSYVIGFILSLIFTAVPYYLVDNKIFSGTKLLVTIICFAIIQMIIQVFFFLHLGRGPKPLYNIVFFIGTVGLIIVVVGGSIFIINNLHYYMAPNELTKRIAEDEAIHQVEGKTTGACDSIHNSHIIYLKNNKLSPTTVKAVRCDTLTIINQDKISHEITFGSHASHGSYSGIEEFSVPKDRSKTITLNQNGTYLYHDHDYPTISGEFTVVEK